MSLRENPETAGRDRFWENLRRLKDLLEKGKLGGEEMMELVEVLERRLAWMEEDNRGYRDFFESLVSAMEDQLQPAEIRELIQGLGLREVLLRGSFRETDTIH